MTTTDLKSFRKSLRYRVPLYIWGAGILVAMPEAWIARFVFHNMLEFLILAVTGLVMMLPAIGVNAWLLHKGRQELRRLEMELIVYETLLKLADPKRYKRNRDIEDLERLFKR